LVIEEIIALMKMYISRYVKLEGQRPGEPSAEVLAEELRVNTTLTSLNLGDNDLEEGGRWQRHCASIPRLRRSTCGGITWKREEDGRWQRRCA
jgi:hypothetical protein